MKRINSLSDLLMEELASLLNAGNQLIEALPKMAVASQSSALKLALEDFGEVTKDQVDRLQDIFSNIAQNAQGTICKDVKMFIKECEDVITTMEKCQERDSAIINVLQRVEDYEITRYKMAREHAADLGHTRIVELLSTTLNEERAMNFHLNELAQSIINVQAIGPDASHQQKGPPSTTKSGGFYIPEGKFSRRGVKKKNKNTDVSRFISEGNPNTQGDN